jgi:hypothetical protein
MAGKVQSGAGTGGFTFTTLFLLSALAPRLRNELTVNSVVRRRFMTFSVSKTLSLRVLLAG